MLKFFKYNIISLLATGIDFAMFVLLTKIFDIWYVYANLISAFSGGMFAFFMNRNWVFHSLNPNIKVQIIKYFLVWGGSIFLNTTGLYLLIENTALPEITAKIIIAVVVGVFFNFLMNRYYVFNDQHKEQIYFS